MTGLPEPYAKFHEPVEVDRVLEDGDVISIAKATGMRFEPAADFNGSLSFDFRALDAAGAESGLATVSIDVAAVNDAPELSGFGDSVLYDEGDGPAAAGTPVLLDASGDAALDRDVELTERGEDLKVEFSGIEADDDRGRARLWLFLTSILGLIFLGFQAYEFTEFYHKGLTLQQNLFGSTFFVLTGFHGTHVAFGVLWLLTLFVADLRKPIKPSQALRQGRWKSSIWLALEAVKRGDADVVISAGNTGALMAMSKTLMKMLPGIDRPAIASFGSTAMNSAMPMPTIEIRRAVGEGIT